MDFAEAYLMCKLGHPELAGWWGKLLGGGGGGDKPWEEMTWDDVIAATKNGKYKNFEIGAMKELDLGSEGIVHMQIVGIDVDDLADGSGKAPLTFISKELLETSHSMNATNTAEGAWEASGMRTYLKRIVKPLIPSTVAAQIKDVKKYSYSNASIANAETTDDVWIPSKREANATNAKETLGPVYSAVFPDNTSRIKAKTGTTSDSSWWLRSSYGTGTSSFSSTNASGSNASGYASNNYGVALGFCL